MIHELSVDNPQSPMDFGLTQSQPFCHVIFENIIRTPPEKSRSDWVHHGVDTFWQEVKPHGIHGQTTEASVSKNEFPS
jgi:hypothetical protein